MTETEIKEIVRKQRSYFYTGATLPVEKRLDALKKLKTCIQKYEPLINEALKRDLGKSNFESYMCEVGLVLSELSYMIRHTPSYAKEKTVVQEQSKIKNDSDYTEDFLELQQEYIEEVELYSDRYIIMNEDGSDIKEDSLIDTEKDDRLCGSGESASGKGK